MSGSTVDIRLHCKPQRSSHTNCLNQIFKDRPARRGEEAGILPMKKKMSTSFFFTPATRTGRRRALYRADSKMQPCFFYPSTELVVRAGNSSRYLQDVNTLLFDIFYSRSPTVRYRSGEESPAPTTRGLRNKSLAVTYFRMGRPHTIIGAERFHFRVRYGIGWYPLAMAARQTGWKDAVASLPNSVCCLAMIFV